MHIVILAGGVGGSRFVRGVRAAHPDAHLTVIGNTADDITLHGLRICPDLDTMMYALGDGIDPERGWGRADESTAFLEELRAYEVEPTWFTLGDRDLATHVIRTQLINSGATATQITAALASRWLPEGITLLPMTDDRVETHVVITDPEAASGRHAVHFQEYWVRLRAAPAVEKTIMVGLDQATVTDEVTRAIASADEILLAPSNPVVSIGPILGVPGLRTALLSSSAPIIGFSPILAGSPVLGMADKLLPTIGVEVSAAGVGRHYGARAAGGLLDLWVVDSADGSTADQLPADGLPTLADELIMHAPSVTAGFVHRAEAHLAAVRGGA